MNYTIFLFLEHNLNFHGPSRLFLYIEIHRKWTCLKHLMAVMVEMKEAKKAAAVVKDVTHMVSIE